MNTVSKLIYTVGLVGLAATASAQVFNAQLTGDTSIPDGDLNGTVFSLEVSLPGVTVHTNAFRVNLNIVGDPIGGNGDLFVYLRSPGGVVAQLLNRPGVPLNAGAGYQDNGMNVTFIDGVDPNGTYRDIHFYQDDPVYGGVPAQSGLTGIFKTDGRDINPFSPGSAFEDSANRTATFEKFQGIDPNGQWLLFAADVSAGGSQKLQSWGIDFTPIPEPQQYAVAIGAGLLAFALYRRRLAKTA